MLNIGMESMIPYPQFYRLHGTRRPVQLVGPTFSKLETLDLPRNSILHFVSDDEAMYGIPTDEYIVRNEPRIILVDHVQALGDELGPPRPTRLPPGSMIREYHRKYRKTRAVTKLDVALRDSRTLIVENYALLPHLYRYSTSYFRGYYKWWNIQAALWKRCGELSQLSERQQYLLCRLPKLLPTLGQLRKGEQQISRQLLKAFTESESLFILEVWKWLGPQRKESVLAKGVDISKMNLIWLESDRWVTVNLGLLDEWRKPTKEELAAGAAEHGSVDADQLQRRFLRMLMFLHEGRTVADVSPTDEVEVTPIVIEPQGPIKVAVPQGDEGKTKTLKIQPGMNVDELPDIHVEETENNSLAIDESITKDLEALDHLTQQLIAHDDGSEEEPTTPVSGTKIVKYEPDVRTLQSSVMSKVDVLADGGLLSGAEYRRFTALSGAFEKLPDPYDPKRSMAERITVDPASLKLQRERQIPDLPGVVDQSMLHSSLFEFDSKYITEVLSKDIVRSVVGLQHAGVAVTGYEINKFEDALNSYEEHSVQLTPVQGKVSTIHFRLPRVAEDGTFRSNGVNYRLRKQRGDVPIRKLSSSRVALTSYYSKAFVSRSEKQVNNYANWLGNQIAAMGMDPENKQVTTLMMSNVFDSNDHTPRVYSILASRFRSFHVGDLEFFFEYDARHKQFGEAAVTSAETDGMVVIGKKDKQLIIVDAADALYLVEGEQLKPLGTMESLLGLNGKAPLEMAELKVFNKHIPVGMFLAYHLGLSQLLELLHANPRRVPTGERLHLSEDEYAIRFEDETLVLTRDNRLAAQILSGIAAFEQSTRNYPIHLFDKKDIYFNVLDQAKLGVRYLREMDLMVDLFVDPITEEILKSMGEPTDFIGLIIRACELLLTDWAPDETDMAYMRIKGYERIAGAVYGEMVRAIRQQRSRGSAANAKIELPPYLVWQVIQQDPAVKLVEGTNPIYNLKEQEEVTFSGAGGRSSRSMVRRTRVYHDNDMGVISEATKDSADVAITTFLTADPNLLDLRGMTGRYKEGKLGPASLLSTSALLAPAADRDDPKRVNFISIQQQQGTFARGYRPTPLRTGYERVIAHRTGDLFAFTAKKAGKVTNVTPKAITVTYDDGSTKSVELGRRFATASGTVFPHSVITALKVGDTVQPGDIVSYNSHYFEPDFLNPKQVLWKAGVLVKTAIMESVDTLEDSSAISAKTAALLETDMTTVREITLEFDQTVHNLVEVGTEVDVESILCTIEDAVSAQNDLFDSDSLNMLRLIAANTPRAKFKGRVEKVEVFYHGDIDDLSASLQELAATSDRNRRREARDLGTAYTTGRVDESMRIEGNPLPVENAVIRVYITGPVSAGVGDKAVFANQLKTIFGRVMAGVNETESGEPIDAIFGYQSISDRIVLSPEIMGTTNTLLKVISKRVVDVYRGK